MAIYSTQDYFPHPVTEHRLLCPHAPEGKVAKVVEVAEPEDVFQAVQETRHAPCERCLLLTLPPDSPCTTDDLALWAAAAEPQAQKVVAPFLPTDCALCGNAPRCRCHTPTLEREALATFIDLLETTHSADVAVERVYMGMDSRDRALVQRWACHRDPELRDRAIRQSMLAAEFGISERQVRRILDTAQAQNPTIFARLLAARKQLQFPGGQSGVNASRK